MNSNAVILKTFVICSIISSTRSLGRLSVRFEKSGLIPDEEGFLTDDSPDTCASIISDHDQMPRHTKFRIDVPDYIIDNATVILLGSNLGCGHNLYVTPLSAAETEKWTGRWTTCPLRETSMYEGKEKCSYDCKCREGCEEIQIIKRPKIVKDSSWNVCYVSITSGYLELTGCSADVDKPSGIYQISPKSNSSDIVRKDVYCDMDTDGGGWTVILRRQDGSVDFNKEWDEYKFGFGSLTGEFWAGNELIHQLTNDGRTYSLRVDLTDYDGNSSYAKYSNLSVGSESTNYTLHVDGYDDNSTADDRLRYHDGCLFSTGNVDNDGASKNIAREGKAPWWYCSHRYVVLTGVYGEDGEISSGFGIEWYDPWPSVKYAKYAVMMIRPN